MSKLEKEIKIVNNEFYIPTELLTDILKLNIEFVDGDKRIINNNSIISIDKGYDNEISKEDALDYLKTHFLLLADVFVEEQMTSTEYNFDSEFKMKVYERLKNNINNLEYSYSISRYYVFDKGMPYTIFFNKYTKDIYFIYESSQYIKLEKIDIKDSSIFSVGYLFG